MGPYAGVGYNLTVCPLQSRLQHIYHGQPYARVDLNPMPESTLTLCQRRLYPPVRNFDFGFSLLGEGACMKWGGGGNPKSPKVKKTLYFRDR
jgi:hypothetical protein